MKYFKATELMKQFEGKEYFLSEYNRENIRDMPYNCVIFVDMTTKNDKKFYLGRNKFSKYCFKDGKLDSIIYEANGRKRFINNISDAKEITIYAWYLEKKNVVVTENDIEDLII